MIRFFETIVIVTTITVAIVLYAFKYDTEHAAKGIDQLKQQIAEEDDAVRILRAEWSLLNQPDRLQKLVERHLELEPLKAEQIQDYADIPRKSPNEELADLVRRTLSTPTMAPPSSTASIR